MSIVTKTGDGGTTALMYNRRVSKCHPRVEAYGTLDELNAHLGLARASTQVDSVRQELVSVQKDLVALMGELAILPEDRERYQRDGYALISAENTAKIDRWISEIESRNITYRGWATPGATFFSAAIDVARTICRRAERHVCALQESGGMANREIIVYLNRLSDWLWLLARWMEAQAITPPAQPV